MDYEVVIGLEVHAQLKTVNKIFCGCPTTYGAEPNTHACPFCLGLPGVLPVLNKRAVVGQEWLDAIRESLPELPDEKMKRFIDQYGLPRYDLEVLTSFREH